MHGHSSPEHTRDQDIAYAFDRLGVTSSDAENMESIVRKKFRFVKRDFLKYALGTYPQGKQG